MTFRSPERYMRLSEATHKIAFAIISKEMGSTWPGLSSETIDAIRSYENEVAKFNARDNLKNIVPANAANIEINMSPPSCPEKVRLALNSIAETGYDRTNVDGIVRDTINSGKIRCFTEDEIGFLSPVLPVNHSQSILGWAKISSNGDHFVPCFVKSIEIEQLREDKDQNETMNITLPKSKKRRGRNKKYDWAAIVDALRCLVEEHGLPGSDQPDGFQTKSNFHKNILSWYDGRGAGDAPEEEYLAKKMKTLWESLEHPESEG